MVFCKDCVHFKFMTCTADECEKYTTWKRNPINGELRIEKPAYCLVKNKNCNCKGFEPIDCNIQYDRSFLGRIDRWLGFKS